MSNAPTHSVHSAIVTGPLLLLLLLLVGCLTPRTARAIDGHDALSFRTISDMCGPLGIGKYEAQDASISYCMNQDCPGPSEPGGPWRAYDQGWTWLLLIPRAPRGEIATRGMRLPPGFMRVSTRS